MTTPTHQAARALCAAGRRAVDLGLSPGTSGNMSVRAGDVTLATPTGVALGELEPDGLTAIDADGTHIDGPRPSKEYPLHRAMYAKAPQARAVVHLHSTHASAASCLPAWSKTSALPPITPYLVMRVGQAPLVPYAAPGSDLLAQNLADLPADFSAALLANHGSILTGPDPDTALNAAIELEEAARLVVLLNGHAFSVLPPDQVRELTDRYGTTWDL